MIETYTPKLNNHRSVYRPRDIKEETVLLSGSTGSLGSQLLASLLSMSNVRRVYALNRPDSQNLSMMERHEIRFKDRGLDAGLLSSPKLVFLEGQNTLPGLGFDEDTTNKLQRELTIIIHAAWYLNLQAPLSKFEPSVKGTRALIDLVNESPRREEIRFLFTSSISVAGRSWDRTRGPFPEEVLSDARSAVGIGYGESKYVTERILAGSGLDVTIVRIGQLCGGEPNGAWSVKEWFPIILHLSLQVGALLDIDNAFSHRWIPIDVVSSSILDFAFSDTNLPLVINLERPKPIPGQEIIQMLRGVLFEEAILPSPQALSLIHPKEWVSILQRLLGENRVSPKSRAVAHAAIGVGVACIAELSSAAPLKMNDRSQSPSRPRTVETILSLELDVSNAKILSRTFREFKPIDVDMVTKWVKYWIAVGILEQCASVQ